MASEPELPNIVIKSEAEAYEVLEQVSHGKIGDYNRLVFDGWPTLSLVVEGEKFDQSLTPTVMKGLIELQRGIYRSYSIAKKGDPSARLSSTERDELEIKVSVNKGSAELEINFQDIAEKMAVELAGRMTGAEIVAVVITIAVLYFGTSAFRSYLQNRKAIREREVSDETQRRTLSTLQFISQQETKRLEILADAGKVIPQVEKIEKMAPEAQRELVKSLANGAESKIDDVSLTADAAEILTQNARRRSTEVRLDGLYRLLRLDWSNSQHFKVRAVSIDSGLTVDADVQDDSLTGKYKDALRSAEWSRKPIALKINARRVGDSYKDVLIIAADMPPQEDKPG